MRLVITRVSQASVRVGDELVAELPKPGLLVLAGVGHGDDTTSIAKAARKICRLRILEGSQSVVQAQAPVLVVSQFTLYGSTRKGGVPSWSRAAPAALAEPQIEELCQELESHGVEVLRGRFGAHMEVASVNDGPVTIWIDTEEQH